MSGNPNTLRFVGSAALLLAAVAGALSLLPAAASAQGFDPRPFSAGAGVALPARGDLPLLPGYQVQVAAELDVPSSRTAFRLQVLFDRFGGRTELVRVWATGRAPCLNPCYTLKPLSAHERLIAGTLDFLVALPVPSALLTPYVVLGGGLFNQEFAPSGSASSRNDFGGDLGVGVRVHRFHVFLEATAHLVAHATDFIPIMVGVRF